MALFELNTQPLFDGKIAHVAPAEKKDLGSVRETFRQWTGDGNDGSEIRSDYRKATLQRWGFEESKALAAKLRGQFDTLFVLGIGGSALGAKALLSALNWSISAGERRKVFFAENLDPIEFENFWSQIQPERTCFVLISKSGGTLETMVQASAIFERLEKLGAPIAKHFVAITDPKKGALRQWAASNSIATLDVPPGVGGRYSVFTPVGILPLAFAGLDVDALYDGATTQYQNREIDQDRIAALAIRLAELERQGFVAHNIMSYSSHLREFGAWFVQLWGESLGKTRRGANPVGMVPLSSVGATDQHSLLQLLVEGPNRVVNGFVKVKEWPSFGNFKTAMAKLPAEFAQLSYAYGKTFGEVLNAEEMATLSVLHELGRPCYEISLSQPTAAPVGALLAFFMDLCVYTGAALGLNPFDQPGVELGKLKMPELLANNR